MDGGWETDEEFMVERVLRERLNETCLISEVWIFIIKQDSIKSADANVVEKGIIIGNAYNSQF